MAQKIRINDFSSYDERFCNNGGAYGFWVDYVEQPDGQFAVYYGTTAEFDYCPYCGRFGDDCGCGGPELISAEMMADIVRRFVPDEDHWMETDEVPDRDGK